jgi:plasmid stability protein
MAALSIRGLDDDLSGRNSASGPPAMGRSMKAEARAILTDAVRDSDSEQGLFVTLLERFGALGGVEFDSPPRSGSARAIDVA